MKENSNPQQWSYCPDSNLQVNSVAVSDDGTRCVFGTSLERGSGHQFNTYLLDNAKNLLWTMPASGPNAIQGVFWVDISGDGEYVASGGQTSPTDGFLQAFAADTGNILLSTTLDSRVNQVSLSQDGSYLAICYASTVEVYQLDVANAMYTKIATESLAPYSVNSCMISADGSTVVASCIQYDDNSSPTERAGENPADNTTGQVVSYSISGSTVTPLGSCTLNTGCMRVAIVDSGAFWAASLHDGSCMLFSRTTPTAQLWQAVPDDPNIELAYAVAVTQTAEGTVYVACGANQDSGTNKGILYFVKSQRMDLEEPGYSGEQYQGVIEWQTPILRAVNPGVSMDLNATYVSATDGKPKGKTPVESPGDFYLFSGADGSQVWQQGTDIMNWPMMVAKNASCVVGGSDNGTFYYWWIKD